MALNFLKSLYADDIFISYSRKDGAAYLTGLDAALSKRGFSCFTDKRGTDAGKLPPETLYSKIRACKTLVLLATPKALEKPENIAPEITQFANANGTSRIICVSFDQDEEFGDWENTPWYTHVEGKAREREHPNTLKTGEPSEKVVEQVVAASDYMKSKDRLRRYRNSALSVLGVLVIAIIGAAIVAALMVRKAKEETDKANKATEAADRATRDAEKSLSQALNAQMEAGMAQLGAEIAKADATEQKKLAEAAAEQARQAQALAAQEQARAKQQQTIAKVRSLANSSQTLLRGRPQEIQRSMTRALEAMKLSDSLKMHILEADTALRDNLTLLGRLQTFIEVAPEEVVALSPDGRHYLQHKYDVDKNEHKAHIFAVGNDALLKQFAYPEDAYEAALSSNLKYAAVNTSEGIKIFDLEDDRRSHLLKNEALLSEEEMRVDMIAISPTGRYLAFTANVGEDQDTHSNVKIIETASGKRIKSFDDLQMSVSDITFGATGNLAVAGAYKVPKRGKYTSGVILWNLTTEDKVDGDFDDASLQYEALEIDGQIQTVTPGRDSFATDRGIWKQVPGSTQPRRIGITPNPFASYDAFSSMTGMAFSENGRTLTLVRNIQAVDEEGPGEAALELWDTFGQEAFTEVFSPKDVYSIAFKTDDRVIAMQQEPTTDQPALVFDARDGKPSDNIVYGPGPTDGEVKYLSPNNSYVVSVTERAAVVWDVWAKKKQSTIHGTTLSKVEGAALNQRGDFLVLSGEAGDGRQFVVFHSDGQVFRKWKRFSNSFEPVQAMSLSADGKKLATIHKQDNRDGPSQPAKVRVWDVGSGIEVTPESLGSRGERDDRGVATAEMKMIALSPSGRFLMTADEHNRSWILDLSAGRKAPLALLIDESTAHSACFSSDDRYLAVGLEEGELHIFDLRHADGVTEIVSLHNPGEVTTVAFSDDNKYLAAATSDRHPYGLSEEKSYAIRIWLLQPRDLLKQATARLESLNRK